MLINYRVGEQFIIGNMEHIDNLDKRMGNDMANQQDTVNHSCHVTRKTYLRGLWPGKTQIGLLNYSV